MEDMIGGGVSGVAIGYAGESARDQAKRKVLSEEEHKTCSRITIKELCRARAQELRRRAHQLDELAGALPDCLASMAPAANDLLWDLVCRVRVD